VEETIRPDNLTDLTKGEGLPPSKNKPMTWHLGPTGISCVMSGGAMGDQLFVQGTIKGSPADGKFLPGDVITGINGVKFQAGGNLGLTIGNAIIEAEREVNTGKITFQVWRDKNYPARTGAKNIAGTDIDQLINEAESDDSLYDWKPEEARKEEVKNMDLDKFPLDPVTLEVELKLRTFPDYADSAPYDCPKTKQILEDAWKSLEQRFIVDPKKPGSGKGGVIEAMGLVSSGKPEHRELVKQWVRSPNCPWQPPTQPIGAMFEPGYKGYKGYQTWHHGFIGLYCAIYYDATGDDYVMPALRKYAIEAAMGQSKAGTWGHTFAFPSFNGGKFHEMNPGYGALNAAGNRCFFLVALAKKLGVEHPEIDAAIARAHNFFGSFVDQGAIPYGDHAAAGTDDSNGKNAGTAFAMKLIGDDYSAKYFAMMSAHASFTPRGGHAHDYHTQWSSWGATLCGPEIRTMAERNMRWRRTLCRMYDGSFVYHSPTEKYGTLRDPTATEVFHQAVILKKPSSPAKTSMRNSTPTSAKRNSSSPAPTPSSTTTTSRTSPENHGWSAPPMSSSTCWISSCPRPAMPSPRNSPNASKSGKPPSCRALSNSSPTKTPATATVPSTPSPPAATTLFSPTSRKSRPCSTTPKTSSASPPSGPSPRQAATRKSSSPCSKPPSPTAPPSPPTASATPSRAAS
jgi:hypothetical protein